MYILVYDKTPHLLYIPGYSILQALCRTALSLTSTSKIGSYENNENQFASICARKHTKTHFVGLGPGSVVVYNMYWLRQMPAHWT